MVKQYRLGSEMFNYDKEQDCYWDESECIDVSEERLLNWGAAPVEYIKYSCHSDKVVQIDNTTYKCDICNKEWELETFLIPECVESEKIEMWSEPDSSNVRISVSRDNVEDDGIATARMTRWMREITDAVNKNSDKLNRIEE